MGDSRDWAEAFLDQNPDCAAELTLDDVRPYAAHHAGGLVVLIARVASGNNWIKMHDSWGPGAPDEPGNIVVHAYPAEEVEPNTLPEPREWAEDGIPRQNWNDGSSVWFFNSGRAALTFFLGRI